MADLSFNNLTSAEKEELALCGITTAEQLQRCSAETLWHDLEHLKEFFPNRVPVLTEKRVQEICSDNVEEEEETSPISDFRLQPTDHLPVTQFKRKRNLRAELEGGRKNPSAHEKLNRMHGLSKHFHAIHCSHPWRVYLGAFATLLLLIPFFALLTIPAMLLTGDLNSGKPIYFAAAFMVLVLPWLLIARNAQCSVCHIPLYRFGDYPHNREAHHLPILGYTITMALHIIFLFWFRCPACGTPMKLFSRSRSHHHHH